jgi:hypothetical protein
MKRVIIITILFAGIIGLQCFAQKKQKVTYEFPPQMAAPVQAEFAKPKLLTTHASSFLHGFYSATCFS